MNKKKDVTDKVPSLLVKGPITDPANYREYRRFEYHKNRLESRNPLTFKQLKKQLEDILDSWEKALNEEI